MLFMILEILLD